MIAFSESEARQAVVVILAEFLFSGVIQLVTGEIEGGRISQVSLMIYVIKHCENCQGSAVD